MNKIIRSLWLVICCLFCNSILFAQTTGSEADVMRGNGKIYVVVAVCLTILIGLFIYVFLLDRKISRLEKGKE
jgi:hypothetical protein